jgi:hypothetical protein
MKLLGKAFIFVKAKKLLVLISLVHKKWVGLKILGESALIFLALVTTPCFSTNENYLDLMPFCWWSLSLFSSYNFECLDKNNVAWAICFVSFCSIFSKLIEVNLYSHVLWLLFCLKSEGLILLILGRLVFWVGCLLARLSERSASAILEALAWGRGILGMAL